MRPIQVFPDAIAETPEHLGWAIVEASDTQVAEMGIPAGTAYEELLMSSDALNFHRIAWRCEEEWGKGGFDRDIAVAVKSCICLHRSYEADDFESALLATRTRARLPFGWTALDLARFRAERSPIQLLNPDLKESKLATGIAAIALQLQLLQKQERILLPIDSLREIFAQRKVVVSGAVIRLIEAGLLECVDEKYHTGKAKEYIFRGKPGENYIALTQEDAAETEKPAISP